MIFCILLVIYRKAICFSKGAKIRKWTRDSRRNNGDIMELITKDLEPNFTYLWYKNLLLMLNEHNYEFASYHDWKKRKRPIILRHDIDNSIRKAVELASIENDFGVKSTYFVLLSSDLYNPASVSSLVGINSILRMGHEIGLHFDEAKYKLDENNCSEIINFITKEAKILEDIIQTSISTVSFHRPSKIALELKNNFGGIVNSYNSVFFNDFKYMSDSRRRWREPVNEIIASEKYDKLHILTHPFWYNDKEMNIHDSIYDFVNAGNADRYDCLADNFTDLESVMERTEI